MVISRSAGVWACANAVTSSAKLTAIVFANDMRNVLVVFIADIFEQVGIRLKHGMTVHGERPGVSSRIVDGGFDLQMTQVGAPKTLHHVQLLSVGMPREIEPEFVVEPDGVDDHRVAIPASDGIPVPGGIGIGGMLATDFFTIAEKDLAVAVDVSFKQKE